MNKVLGIVTGIIAVIPGLATLRDGLWAPEKYKLLFGGFIEFFCALSILILWTRRKRIKQILPSIKLKLTLLFVFVFLLSTSTYIFLLNKTDINHSSRGNAFFPILLTGDLKNIVDKSGSRLAAIEDYGIDEINEQLFKQPDINFTMTILTLLAVYTILFVCLTLTFGINSIEYDE